MRCQLDTPRLQALHSDARRISLMIRTICHSECTHTRRGRVAAADHSTVLLLHADSTDSYMMHVSMCTLLVAAVSLVAALNT